MTTFTVCDIAVADPVCVCIRTLYVCVCKAYPVCVCVRTLCVCVLGPCVCVCWNSCVPVHLPRGRES
jgi:hypothetical protein